MRDDYKVSGQTVKLSTEIEAGILEAIQAMSDYTKLSVAELTNTALKRFVSGHKDFLPPTMPKKPGEPTRKAG